MTRRLALLGAGLVAAASFAAPASADPPCFSQDVRDCLRPVTQACVLLIGDLCYVHRPTLQQARPLSRVTI